MNVLLTLVRHMFHNCIPVLTIFQIHHFHKILIFQCSFDFLGLLIWQWSNQSQIEVFSFHMMINLLGFFHRLWFIWFRWLTLICESWGKKSKTRDRDRACFAEKNPERSLASICILFRALDFFSGKRARLRSQKMAYIFVQHGIFPLILAYAIWNLHYSIAQLTLYLYI